MTERYFSSAKVSGVGVCLARYGAVLLVLLAGVDVSVAQSSTGQSGTAQSGNAQAGTMQAGATQAGTTGTSGGSGFQGSVVDEPATPGVLALPLDVAIQKALKHNLGLILQGQSAQSAGGQRLQQLQSLLPVVNASVKEDVSQTNLRAQGISFPGFPAVVGPYGYTDIRASLNWALLNVPSLENYIASKHNFAAAKLSIQDARDMVVLTTGNAYLTCIADAARIESTQAQVDTAKVSLDQAVASHAAGTVPRLDELRARVDYQTQQQALISAKNQYEKDKIALARVIGLPLEQQFSLTDQAPYAALDGVDADTAVAQALKARSDLKSLEEQVTAAEKQKKAAVTERLPQVSFSGDYGDIGVNPSSSHGTGNAVGTASVPVFEEGKLRGDARVADAALQQKRAQLSDLREQISADVRNSILDIQTAAKLLDTAGSNVQLAKEALSEAQQRYSAGVSDNLAVSQAQSAMAQADDQYVSSLYQHNVAKLSLARALGVADIHYKDYVGGK